MGELIIAIGTVVAIAEKIIKKDQRKKGGYAMNPIKILTGVAAIISIVKDLDNFRK